jgi:hypothetical protein
VSHPERDESRSRAAKRDGQVAMTDAPIGARVVERARHEARQPARHRRPESAAHAPVSAALVSARPNWKTTSTGLGVMRKTVRTVIEIDPHSVDILDQAEREHYRIMACTLCGDPEVHAKHKPAAKCFRCGHYRTLDRITGGDASALPALSGDVLGGTENDDLCKLPGKMDARAQNLTPARPRRSTLENDLVSLRILGAFRAVETSVRADPESCGFSTDHRLSGKVSG